MLLQCDIIYLRINREHRESNINLSPLRESGIDSDDNIERNILKHANILETIHLTSIQDLIRAYPQNYLSIDDHTTG